MEVYSLGLYLVAQFYLREAHKADTADTWPSELFSMQQEPSSPMHMTAKAWGRDAGACLGRATRQHSSRVAAQGWLAAWGKELLLVDTCKHGWMKILPWMCLLRG